MSLDFEGMVQLTEGCGIGDIGDYLPEALLNAITDRNILHAPAADAHEMMVVSGQPLRQLVTGEPRRGEVRSEHARLLEDGKRPVEGRKGYRITDDPAQLGGRTRPIRLGERTDDDAAALCVPNLGFGEPPLNFAIQGWRCHRRSF